MNEDRPAQLKLSFKPLFILLLFCKRTCWASLCLINGRHFNWLINSRCLENHYLWQKWSELSCFGCNSRSRLGVESIGNFFFLRWIYFYDSFHDESLSFRTKGKNRSFSSCPNGFLSTLRSDQRASKVGTIISRHSQVMSVLLLSHHQWPFKHPLWILI